MGATPDVPERSPENPIRLIIADDHALFRQGLKSLLGRHPDVHVVCEVERAGDLDAALREHPSDILLLDLQMDDWMMGDIEALARRTRVIMVTASESLEDAVTALRLGARAAVQKRYAVETLMAAVRAVARGDVWMPPAIQGEIVARLGTEPGRQLTARESEIVRCVARGLRNAEVAARLAITEGTVKTHLNNIFQKLGLRDRAELTRYALRNGLASIRETL